MTGIMKESRIEENIDIGWLYSLCTCVVTKLEVLMLY
jgi:hypothetical protein